MHTLLPTLFFFLPVERGIGRHDNNRLSKAPSTSHTSHYLTQTVQANACEGDFPMMVIKVNTRSGLPHIYNGDVFMVKVKTRSGLPHMEMCSWLRSTQEVDYHIIMEMCSWLRSRQEVDYHIWRCVHTPYPHNVLLPPFQFA